MSRADFGIGQRFAALSIDAVAVDIDENSRAAFPVYGCISLGRGESHVSGARSASVSVKHVRTFTTHPRPAPDGSLQGYPEWSTGQTLR